MHTIKILQIKSYCQLKILITEQQIKRKGLQKRYINNLDMLAHLKF